MKEVKTQKRYKCDFCKKRGIKKKMLWHEKNCYRNPDRVCSGCENTGKVSAGDDYNTPIDCPYCSAFDLEKLKKIEEYEKEIRV